MGKRPSSKATVAKTPPTQSAPAQTGQAPPRPDVANPRSDERDNNFKFDITKSDALQRDLGAGQDEVEIKGDVDQIRVTFTSADVGNGDPFDGENADNEDGGLAVRVQAEDGSGNLTGPISRFDDEGITFTTKGDAKFDVRDLPTGTQRGDMFDVVTLGTIGADTFDESGETEAYYINAGMGNDTVLGGLANDFLVGGGGNDTIAGNEGNDGILGGGGDDRALLNVVRDGSDRIDLGAGDDNVVITAPAGGQIRLTFNSADVGNGDALDGNNATNEDGGLAVRLQLEGAGDTLVGPISRTDDEGITFTTVGDAKFDVRDLPTGTQRGNMFDVVELGTSGADVIDESGESEVYYINAGGGDDTISGGLSADFLVGGAGADRINGNEGNDRFIGGGGNDILTGGSGNDVFIFAGGPGSVGPGPGNDTITDFTTTVDKINLSAYGITAANVTTSTTGTTTTVFVDSDKNGIADFQIELLNSGPPVAADYIF